jgi:tRNA-2-methylthio-N6-dimethylallyladenosine synthase
MNVYDSVRMGDLLKPFGYALSDTMEDADMVILNTCHIREKAAEKVYSELGRVRAHKEVQAAQGKEMLIAVAGCVGQAEGEEIFRRAPFVDIVVGPQSYHSLPQLITEVARKSQHALNLDFPAISKFDSLPEESLPQGISAFLTIQEGCNEFCKYCVVPYTRGIEFSRPVSEIYREAVRMVAQGSREITLLGQNVNAYLFTGEDGAEYNLGKLVTHLAKIEGLQRIRYTTSHPRSMHEDLIEAHGQVEKLMPFLHLPIQSGSNRILHDMNRKHTVEEYLSTIAKLKAAKPEMGFSSDFIVGYPGETEQDFEDTLALVRQVKFAQAYSFKFSPRPGTPASINTNQIPEDVKSERLSRLQALITAQQEEFNQSFVGQEVEVLFDKEGKHEHQITGKSPYMQSVYINHGREYLGQTVSVKIEEAFTNSLMGRVVTEPYAIANRKKA